MNKQKFNSWFYFNQSSISSTYILPFGSNSSGLSRLAIVILIFFESSSRTQAIGVPHSTQKKRVPWEEDFIFLGLLLRYLKRSTGIASHETNGAPEVLLYIEQKNLRMDIHQN